MGLKAEIQDGMKAAMKGGDRVVLSTLRLLLSALHNEEIKQHRELSTDEILKTVASLCKQRQESIEYFRKGGRTDLWEQEEAELAVLRRFLPEGLSEEEVRAAIQSSIEEVGAKGMRDLGRVMKQVMPKVTGRTDGKRVSDLAKEILSGK
ncbi:MAG TPA: GatB/YqeY domain-containing protein [Candidatus Binatia bacterium]